METTAGGRKTKRISSDKNPAFRMFRALTKARAVRKKGLALLSGPKQIIEVALLE